MAKAKKKEALSLEEKLEQALVPVDEQPYEVPENWCWVKLMNLCDDIIVPQRDKPKKFDGDIPWCRIEDIEGKYLNGTLSNQYVTSEIVDAMNLRVCPEGAVICSCSASLGRQAILTRKCCTNQTFIGLVCNSKLLNNHYLYYYLMSLEQYFQTIGTGTTIKYISRNKFEQLGVSLPSLLEQQRIVEQIESLFARLEEVKAKLEEALDEIDKRTEIVLHNFFTGKYISDSCSDAVEQMLEEIVSCREQMISRKEIQRAKVVPVSEQDKLMCIPQNWKQVKMGEIAFVTKLAGFEYTKYISLKEEGEVPVVRAQNVRKGYLNLNNVLYIDKKTSVLLERSALKKKSLLITFIGAGIGDVCVFDKPERYHLAPNVAKVELFGDNILNAEYILYYLLSDIGQKEIFKSMKATAQPSLSMETIRDIVIPIPEISVQNKIVDFISVIKEKELKEKELIKNTLLQIELMKKSILAKAFRGKLGTNNPDEESSLKLLKQIIAENM